MVYGCMRWSVRCSHKKRQRRNSGKRSLIYSRVLETGDTLPGSRGQTAGWSGGRRQEPGQGVGLSFIGVSVGKADQDARHLGLAGVTNVGGSGLQGCVSSCLVPGPGLSRAQEYCSRVVQADPGGEPLDWLVHTSKAHSGWAFALS